MFSIPGLKVVSLTDAAATRIREIMAQSAGEAEAPALGLRVGVKKGGCAGMEYTFEVARETNKGDEVVTEKDATVIVDAKAVLFLLGTELDFKTDRFSSTFVFNNPNQVSACGCGESVEIKPRAEPVARRTDVNADGIREDFRGYLERPHPPDVRRSRHL
jgi:iron-sulfur cluster assembly protein